jgi:CRP-like cAMP-binding protein
MATPEDRPIDFRIFKDIYLLETHYSAGSEILGPGKAIGLMYVVKSGVVSVQVQGVTVEEIRDGGIFGEMGMVDPKPHSANIFAVTDVEAFVLNQTQFLQIVGASPTFALRVMKVLARRLRAMNARFHETSAPLAEAPVG